MITKSEPSYSQIVVPATEHRAVYRPVERNKIDLSIGANSGYWLIKVDEKDCNRTVAISQFELYQFFRSSYTLKITMSAFQRWMDVILFPVQC